ncbi:MAG: hypothetical protein ACJAWW_001686 [Sulfurimonas sp.]|jgi:hypothetical protein
MKNLGKIVLVIFLLQYTALASVKATVDSSSVELGDMVTYSLHLSGADVQRPIINTLCGVDVISTSSQTSIEMINGDISRNNILSYKFVPQESCTIDPIDVEIDGKIEKTNSVKVNVGAVVASKDANFILTLESTSKEVFVGEPFEVTLLFKQRQGAEAVDSKFLAPKLKGFWIKGESKPQRSQEGEYAVTKIIYTMAAQRVGKLTITKAQMRVAARSHERDSWGSWVPRIKWKTYFSNELNIDVKALPGDVKLVGDFSITATADKLEINPNEAINLNIEVLGSGNLEDIKSFKPYMDNVSVFDEKVVVNGNKLTQKIAFVGEKDFTIPAFTLKYFDPITKEVKTTFTNEIHVKVKNQKQKEELTIKREKIIPKETILTVEGGYSKLWIIAVFIFGLVSGILVMFFKPWKIFKKERSVSIKDPKTLLIKLFPYRNDEQVQNIIDILEKNIYSDAKIELDKKLLKETIKRYGLV